MLAFQIGCPKPLAGSGHKASITFSLAPKAGETISKVGPGAITKESLIKEFRSQPAYLRQKILKDEMEAKKFLNTEIRKELLFFEAIKRGMLDDAEVQDSLKKILVQKITKEEFNDQKTVKTFSDKELRSFYNEHIDRFRQPEKMSLTHIFVPFGADRKSSYQKIKSTYEKLVRVTDVKRTGAFASYAKSVSDFSRFSDNAEYPGVISFKSKEELNELFGAQLGNAAFALKHSNDISSVKQGGEGYFIFQSLARRKGINRSLNEAKKAIERRLYYENRRKVFVDFIDKLTKEIGVSTSWERLSKLRSELANVNDYR